MGNCILITDKFEYFGMSPDDYSRLGVELQSLLSLTRPPIAVSFDADVTEFERSTDVVPSSCTFWTKALNRTFYTEVGQHQNCTIGAVTHGYRLARDSVPGCGCGDVDLLASVGWISKEDIEGLPAIPINKERRIAYAPLSQTSFTPDVVLMFCNPEQAMMIAEATAGYAVTGKPTCQALPEAYNGKFVISLGCTASRLRAGYDSNDLVVAVPPNKLASFVDRLRGVVDADTKVAQAVSQGKG